MNKTTEAQLSAAAEQLDRQARGRATAEEHAKAARLAYNRLSAHLGTLVGETAARALFLRSLKLRAAEFPSLRKIFHRTDRDADLGERLAMCSEGEAPEDVEAMMVAVFATLLTLLGTLIGDRLTAQVLRDSNPGFRVSETNEEKRK